MKYKKTKIVSVGLCLFIGWLSWPGEIRTQDFDLYSGRVRYQTYWGKVMYEERFDTMRIAQYYEPIKREPDWRRVNKFTNGGRVSPHYYYHGALSDDRSLMQQFEYYKISEARRREVVKKVFELWQKDEGDFEASEYIMELGD